MTARRTVAAALAVVFTLAAGLARADDEGDKATLARLEQRSRAFYDLLERGDRAQAGTLWAGLADDLAGFAARLRERLDKEREDVLDRDGDLDALYREPRWREPEIMSLVATYHLAWVRYQGAQLVGDAAKKKALLTKAVEGFSQFLLVNEVPEIYGESLYGRGLAFLDLGDNAKAIEDLTAAVEEPHVAGKAKAALEEARRRATGKAAPAENDPETLLARLGDLLPRAAAGDAAAAKDATDLARGLAARGGTWPTRVAGAVQGKLGDGSATGVRASYGVLLLAQLAVDRGRCADVPALAAVDPHDAGRSRERPETLFLAGGCLLNGGQAREAAETFATLEHEFPDAPRAREAAYYRIRALDVARADDPTLVPSYEEALTGYLSRYPKADNAGEIHLLLAELHRTGGDCARAAADYAAVGSGPFATRARLGSLECQVAALGNEQGPESAARRQAALDALRAFVRDTPARGDDQARVARAALLGAVVAAGATPPDHAAVVALLDGFAGRYPDARELHARALELRLGARVASGDLDGAGHDLDAFLAAPVAAAERRQTLARLGRQLAIDAERAPAGQRDAPLGLARRVYEALFADGKDPRDRIALADLTLRAGDAPAARRLYEEALQADPGSTEALRGAATAAAAAGDRAAALARWRAVLEASTPGGTAWYEARLAQVTLLAADGQAGAACEIVRASRGRATSTGGDQLEARLRAMEPQVCR